MRRFLLFGLVLLLSLPAPTSAQTFEVTDRVSDVTGVRRIASADLRPLTGGSYSGSHAAFRAVYEKDPDAGASWTLTVFGYASDTTGMGRTRTVRLRADGTAIEPLRIASKIRRLDASLVEIKQISLARSAFTRLARADTVVLSVGPAQFPMSRVRRTDLRLILKRVSKTPPRQASGTAPPDTSGVSTGGR